MDTNSDVYRMVKFLNDFRNNKQIWNLPQIQRYADDKFYAFTRGEYFFAFTNQDYDFSVTIGYHPYSNGTKVCNIFDANDNITINNNQFTITMGQGNFKIYQKCGNMNGRAYLSELYRNAKKMFGFSAQEYQDLVLVKFEYFI